MSTETTMAKKAVQDKIESQVHGIQAKLDTLRAKAEAAKANAELKAIAELFTKKQAIDEKIAELQKSVQAIEAKFKTA